MTAKELLTILQQEKYDVKNLPVGYFKDDQHFIRLIGVDIENCLDDGYRLVLTFDEETDA